MNEQLSVSPPLDSGQRFSPGQVFLFRLTLGSKVALSSYDKIQVRLVGNCYVNSVRSIFLPRSLANRTRRNRRTTTTSSPFAPPSLLSPNRITASKQVSDSAVSPGR